MSISNINSSLLYKVLITSQPEHHSDLHEHFIEHMNYSQTNSQTILHGASLTVC